MKPAYKTIYLLLFLLLYTESTCIDGAIIKESAAIANRYFCCFPTLISWSKDMTESEHVSTFIKLFRGCAVLAAVGGSNETIGALTKSRKIRHTVFLATQASDVEPYLKQLRKSRVIPIRTIVVITQRVSQSDLSKLMEIAWENDVADIVVTSPNSDNEVSLHTYFPYSNGKCVDFTPVPMGSENEDLFPGKFNNFHKCHLRTVMVHLPPRVMMNMDHNELSSVAGIDWDLLLILADKINARIVPVIPRVINQVGVIGDGNATGSLKYLVTGRADIHVPALFLNRGRYRHVQVSHTHHVIEMFWFGPRRRRISAWYLIFQPLMSTMATSLIICAVIFATITKFIRRLEKFSSTHSSSENGTFFRSFAAVLGLKIDLRSVSVRVRFLFTLWIFVSMIFRIGYQCSLVIQLQGPLLEPPLVSFESAVEQVDGYGGVESVRENFFKNTSFYEGYTIVPAETSFEMMKDIESGKRFLMALDWYVGAYVIPDAQVLPNTIEKGFRSLMMRPSWAAAPEIDRVFLRMIESGLTEMVSRRYFRRNMTGNIHDDNDDTKALSLQTLIGCFYGVVAMYGVCTLIFIAEIIYFKIKQKKLN